MEKVYRDFTGMGVNAIKNEGKKMVIDYLKEVLNERFDTVKQIGTGELAVIIGYVRDEDGWQQEVPLVVKTISKPFYSKTEGLTREVRQFDIFEEANAYEKEQKIKADKKKEG